MRTTTVDAQAVREVIRQHVLSTALAGEPADSLRDNTPLRTSGILDSFATMSLVELLGREFGVELDVYETSVERFDRVEDMAQAVLRKFS